MTINDVREFRILRSSSRAIAMLMGASLLAPAGVLAEAKDKSRIEEVTVTAEKREESILKVPLTMSAFSEQMIEQLGMTNDQDLEQLVPGLQFAYDSEGAGVAIRGIGTQKAAQYNADLAVAFYVDGVYTYAADNFGLAPNLFDVERVEVARGPQGTLNGRNSIAGSINYVSKKPTDTWDMSVLTEFTDQFTQRYNMAFGGPLTDQFSFRISGGYFEGDGAQENLGTGGDYDAPDQYTIAPAVRFKTERTDIVLRYQKARDTGSNRAMVTFVEVPRNTTTLPPWGSPNPFYLYDKPTPSVANCAPGQFRDFGGICGDLENKILANRASQNDSESDRWTLNAAFDLTDQLQLKYTYGQSETHTFGTRDGDRTDRVGSTQSPTIPQDCVDKLGVAGCAGVIFSDTETGYFNDNEEHSHEIQLVSNLDGPFNFIVGAYLYENEANWTTSGANYAAAINYANAETVARNLDRNNDGTKDYTSCADFYEKYIITELGRSRSEWIGCEPGDNHLFKGGSSSGAASDTKAVFGNIEYAVNDAWQVAAGLRWTEDEKRQIGINGFSQVSNQLGVPIRLIVSLSNRVHTWDATIGHVSVEFTPEDGRLYYGRISTGYRAGGFNQISGGTSADDIANNIVPANFKEEILTNYELGAKGKFLDQRLTLMAGIYLQDFDDYQFNASQYISGEFVGKREDPFLEYTANIDGTKIWGAEIEGTWYVADRWRLSGFYNYLDSSIGNNQSFFFGDRDANVGTQPLKYTRTDDATGVTQTIQIAPPRDNTGKRLPQQPKHKGALTVTYSYPLQPELGSLDLLSTISYTGERYPNIGNIDYQRLPGYARWDLRASWGSSDGVWNATFYVQNVLDEIGIGEFVDCCNGGWLTDPRQLGLQLRWRPQL